MGSPLQLVAFVVAVPAAVAGALLLASLRASARVARVAGALAVAAAGIAGSWALLGPPRLYPIEVSHRFFAVVLAASLGAASLGLVGRRGRWLVRLAAALAVALLVIQPLFAHRFSGAPAMALASAVAVASATALGLCFESLGRRAAKPAATVVLVAATAASIAAGLSGTLIVAKLGGAVTAGLGAVWLLSMFRWGRPEWLAGAAPAAAAAVWAVTALAVLYAAMSWLTALAVLAVGAIAALAFAVSGRRAGFVAVVAALLVAAAAGALGARSFFTDDSGSSDDYDYGYE